ncbi:hypothetical protein PMKS-004057 [Pichia membranifaciens]|uniref:Uncharacterized protein n=1 Tax=Pichia membranifaciens TaxID=4926 RepID=A0A1Q2YMD9_9ASCO|nr:hypothetical protein PMKS-004057 [Pichia membranifaciens]
MTTSVIVQEGTTSTSRGYVVGYPRGTSTSIWGAPSSSQYTTTITFTTTGVTKTSAYIVKLLPSYSYVYSSGTDTIGHTESYTRTNVVDGVTSEYIEVDIVYPTPYTSISAGTVETTFTTTRNGKTYVVVEDTNFPTTTSFWTKNYATTTYTPIVVGTSTSWEWEVIYPTPSTTINEWSGIYTRTQTNTLYYQSTLVTGFEVVKDVPSYSQEVSLWTGTGYSTATETGVFTNRFGIVSTSTYKVVYRPSSLIQTTSTWKRPETSTILTETTVTGNDGFPITTTEEIIIVPDTSVINSWTTSEVYGHCDYYWC